MASCKCNCCNRTRRKAVLRNQSHCWGVQEMRREEKLLRRGKSLSWHLIADILVRNNSDLAMLARHTDNCENN